MDSILLDIIGAFGTVCFSLCLVPQLSRVLDKGRVDGLSIWFLYLNLIGEFFTASYIFLKHNWDWPLLISCFINIFLLITICRYYYWPRKPIKRRKKRKKKVLTNS